MKLNLPSENTIRDMRSELGDLNRNCVALCTAEALGDDADAVRAVQVDASPAGREGEMAVAPVLVNRVENDTAEKRTLVSQTFELQYFTGKGEATVLVNCTLTAWVVTFATS